ncbi:hypothetical protein Hanom_Chr12g01064941 [Helianthus anomalus]
MSKAFHLGNSCRPSLLSSTLVILRFHLSTLRLSNSCLISHNSSRTSFIETRSNMTRIKENKSWTTLLF